MRQSLVSLGFLILAAASLSCSQADRSDPIRILDKSDSNSVANYLPDFSYAGYNHGVGDLPILEGEKIHVTDYGVVPNDDIDDSLGFLEALEDAHKIKGPVVIQLPAGQLLVSEILQISRSDIVIRGAGSGAGGTELHMPRPLQMVDRSNHLDELREYLLKYDKRQREANKNIDFLFSEYSWTGGFIWVQKKGTRAAAYLESKDPKPSSLAKALTGTRGETVIRVDKSANLNLGDVIELQWFNRQGEKGALIDEIYGKAAVGVGSHHWTFQDRPLVRQKTKILSKNGNQVTISDPLLHNISDVVPAYLASWDHIQNVGIENLRLTFPKAIAFGHHLERGYNGIYFTSVFDGWIKDVTIENADSGILTYNSANVTISDIQTLGDRAAHYSVHAGNVHNMLVRNLTVNNPALHSLSVNTQSTKCVFQNAIVNSVPALDQHSGANHQNLFDNVTVRIDALRDENGPFYPIWNGSGAPYWRPGHGRYNTTWNLKLDVVSGAAKGETVTLRGASEGPDARIVGVSGNREFEIDYSPTPYLEGINREMSDVPSLYSYQLAQRTKSK